MPIALIKGDRVERLSSTALEPAQVGAKGHGLAQLPEAWCPPFFVIDANTIPTAQQLEEARQIASIPEDSELYLRSSGENEGLEWRGKLDSVTASFGNLLHKLSAIRSSLDTHHGSIHWVVQFRVASVLKGHLSNERRLTAVARDWVAETEPSRGNAAKFAKVAHRAWRQGSVSIGPIACDMRANIARALRVVAAWRGNKRTHFEWVWDGSRIWVVQLDPAICNSAAVDPAAVVAEECELTFEPEQLSAFRIARPVDLETFPKLKNANIYSHLGYSMPSFYIIDRAFLIGAAQREEEHLERLARDLDQLCIRPLVIRTDGLNIPADQRQMLPRSDELRSSSAGLSWFRERLIPYIKSVNFEAFGLILIAHHFLPALASAWCLAYPDNRRVRVEALWGIPEGLYYFPHDVFDIDTGHASISEINRDNATVLRERVRYKGKFIAPDINGKWVIHDTKAGPDWARSVKDPGNLREIAVSSREIAAREGFPVVVMWFIGLSSSRASPLLPWYHERWSEEQSTALRNAPSRASQLHDTRVLTSSKDLDNLIEELNAGSRIAAVEVDPREDEVVRKREFIDRLAESARNFEYEVQLRGGVLSHVFYALASAGCRVSCIDLFAQDEETIDYHKLVRDLVPSAIMRRGEDVEIVRVVGEARLWSLRSKLVEESIEVLDALDTDEIISELADVLEVVDSLLECLGVSRAEVEKAQARKSAKRGAFKEGLMLVKTHLTAIASQQTEKVEGLATLSRIEDLPQNGISLNIDRRQSQLGVWERQITFDAGFGAKGSSLHGHSIDLPTPDGHPHPMVVEISTSRLRDRLRVKLRVINSPIQLELF